MSRPPKSIDPLGKAIGRKIRYTRLGRRAKYGGYSKSEVARQLGITQPMYVYVEKGYIIPGPKLARRLYNWMTGGITYEGAPMPTEKAWALERRKQGWKTLGAVLMSPDTARDLRGTAKRFGMTQAEVALMAIERFVRGHHNFTTLAEAVEHVRHVRVTQALTEAPELRDILECEIGIATVAGAVLTPWHTVEEKIEPPMQKLLDLEPFDIKLDVCENRSEVDEI